MKRPWRTASVARPTSAMSSNGGARLSKPMGQTVRGRISNPIPVNSTMEDDEFPMRRPGSGIASGPGEEPKDDPIKAEPAQQSDNEEFPIRPAAAQAVAKEPETTTDTTTKDAMSEARSSPIQTRPAEQRTNPSSTLRQSMISSDTARTRSSKGHEKKKSGLRGALGKLFGRKKKTDSVVISESSTAKPTQTNQHQSDPSALRRSGSKRDASRSVSMPISQYDRALRSHSIGPDDVLAVDEARNSIGAGETLVRRRAGATSTHLVGVRSTRDNDWIGLTPRPASTHGPRSRSRESASKIETGEIGRAITSDFTGLKRRSRSLSFLANVPPDEDGGHRRSNELRYWRESYEPNIMSPISSNAEDLETAPMSMELPRMTEEVSLETPLQPFQFGDLATMNEMAGMRITEAVSMDSRIGSLEARVKRLESVVTQLCDTTPNFRPKLEAPNRAPPPPPNDETASGYTLSIAGMKTSAYPTSGREMKTSTRPSTQQSQMSKTSFGDTNTFVDSMPRSFGQGMPQSHKKERPISTATIRGATSLPSLTKDGHTPFTIDHYTTLMALIDTERSARQALEAQVKVMGHQMAIMSKSIRKRNGRTNSTVSGIQTSAFDVDEDDEDELHAMLARERANTGSQPGPGVAAGDDDYESEEPFTTPHEVGQTFEEQLREDESRRKAERTMSLSRLTLGATPS